jgi:hypothetical protein
MAGIRYSTSASGDPVAIGSMTARTGLTITTLHLALITTTGECVVFSESLTTGRCLGVVDGQTLKLSVQKRGWIFSDVLITLADLSAVFQCTNDYADLLRGYFGEPR